MADKRRTFKKRRFVRRRRPYGRRRYTRFRRVARAYRSIRRRRRGTQARFVSTLWPERIRMRPKAYAPTYYESALGVTTFDYNWEFYPNRLKDAFANPLITLAYDYQNIDWIASHYVNYYVWTIDVLFRVAKTCSAADVWSPHADQPWYVTVAGIPNATYITPATQQQYTTSSSKTKIITSSAREESSKDKSVILKYKSTLDRIRQKPAGRSQSDQWGTCNGWVHPTTTSGGLINLNIQQSQTLSASAKAYVSIDVWARASVEFFNRVVPNVTDV